MEEKKTSACSNGLIWFGAAISIAEIMTGMLFAPLGFQRGFAAILLGHAVGCALLFLAGLIGGKTGKSSMETVKMSFGTTGSLLFSALNVLQLVGWTAVMICSGASAAGSVMWIGGDWVWSVIIGGLIIVWLLIGVRNLGRVNLVAMSALLILTVILSILIFGHHETSASGGTLSFGAAVELSVTLPLSWLPLISDYTRTAKKPVSATLASAGAYFFASSWMFVIGLGTVLFTGESDVAAMLQKAGLGIIALLIVIFATVTTTFLDAYSAGVSAESICGRLKETPVAVGVCVLGVALAIFTPITQFETFLYLIGSVFAPMAAILIVDYFILKTDSSGKRVNALSLGIWLVGVLLYRRFLSLDTPIGETVPVMIITALLRVIGAKYLEGKKHAKGTA